MFLSAPSEDGYLLNGEAKQALIFMILLLIPFGIVADSSPMNVHIVTDALEMIACHGEISGIKIWFASNFSKSKQKIEKTENMIIGINFNIVTRICTNKASWIPFKLIYVKIATIDIPINIDKQILVSKDGKNTHKLLMMLMTRLALPIGHISQYPSAIWNPMNFPNFFCAYMYGPPSVGSIENILENSIARREKLLSNEGYVNNAPSNIVDAERQKLEEEKGKLEILISKIN